MPNQRLLRWLVVADILLTVALIITDLALESTLPEPLRKYTEEWGEPQLTLIEAMVVASAVVMLALLIPAWISLLNFWRYGPMLYLAAFGVSLVGTALAGPSVNASASATLESIGGVVSGMILTLVFFTDLRERFRLDAP